MSDPAIIKRCGPILQADKSRVLLRRLYPSSHEIARRICQRLFDLGDVKAAEEVSHILDEWGDRHSDVENLLIHRFREVRLNVGEPWRLTDTWKTLVGAYFMHEYSIESAALFNPSVVPHWDQSGLAPGATRFIISLRATGEGHISSVTFREGVINSHNRVSLVPSLATIVEAKVRAGVVINKTQFMKELQLSHGVTKSWTSEHTQIIDEIFATIGDEFKSQELRQKCSHALSTHPNSQVCDTACQSVLLLAEANYSVHFADSALSQRVLFPSAPSQSNGIEDARFVQFTDDDGSKKYLATFTAYNGRSTLPQLMETDNFTTFRFMTLIGDVTNKGMALFPRKVNGKYLMLSRQDDENILLMQSETLYKWEDPEVIIRPEQPWEMFKMGNCGSPLETDKGWLVLTHGVGPMRRYALGAVMLDLNNPLKVIGRLKDPLLAPNEAEREGYVPNVVYTCGAMIHNNIEVLIPYAMSDSTTSFATASLASVYAAMGL